MARYAQPKWEKDARNIQEQICQLVSNREWEHMPKGQRWRLERKVGFWLYNLPTLNPSSENNYLGYSKTEVEKIQKICDTMLGGINFEETDIHFAVVFIVVGFDKEEIKNEQKKLLEEEKKLVQQEEINLEKRTELLKEQENLNKKMRLEIQENTGQKLAIFQKQQEIDKKTLENQAEYNKNRELRANLKKASFEVQEVNQDQIFPLFKCRAASSESEAPYVVVDSWEVRRYKNWKDFVGTETLPKLCRYCAPVGGVYKRDEDGKVLVECNQPRASWKQTTFMTVVDVLVPVAEITVVGVSFIVPFVGIAVTAGVSLAAVAYQTTRAGLALKDLKSHGQSLRNRKAIEQWVTIAFSALGPIAPGLGLIDDAVNLGTRSSMLLIRGARIALSGTFVAGRLTAKILTILNHFSNLMLFDRWRKLELCDFENLKFLFLAYINVSITYGSDAETIFKTAKSDFLNSTRAGLPMTFLEMKENVGPAFQEESVQEFTNFTISNTLNLMQALSLFFNDNKLAQTQFERYFSNEGELILDRTNFRAQVKWMHAEEPSRLDTYHSTERFVNANINIAHQAKQKQEINGSRKLVIKDVETITTRNNEWEHRINLKTLLKTFKISFESMHQSVADTLCARYTTVLELEDPIASPDEILVCGKPIFANLTGHQLTRLALAQVFQYPLDQDKTALLSLVHKFAEHMQCKTFRMYLKYAEYVAIKFYEKRTDILNSFRQKILDRQLQVPEDIGGHRVEASRGLLIDRAQAHTLTVEFFNRAYRLDDLRDGFSAFNKARLFNFQVPPIGSLETSDGDLAAYHHHKHKYFEFQGDSRLQILEDYIQLIETVFGRDVNRANVVKVDSDAENRSSGTLVTYKCPKQGVVAVVINKYFGEDGNTSGIITCMSYSSPPNKSH